MMWKRKPEQNWHICYRAKDVRCLAPGECQINHECFLDRMDSALAYGAFVRHRKVTTEELKILAEMYGALSDAE
jgi:hypothetical protein